MMSPLIHIWGMVVGGGDWSFLLFSFIFDDLKFKLSPILYRIVSGN